MDRLPHKFRAIREWAADDRPREKLVLRGAQALGDAELLAILIGTGTRSLSAVDIARDILEHCGQSIPRLSRLTLKDLMAFKGMGEAKSVTLLAALELSRRRRVAEAIERQRIHNSGEAYEYFAESLGDLVHEEFWALYLARNNHVIASERVSEGGISSTIVDPKKLFSRALYHKASSIIVAHNHPSGNQKPSEADIRLTKRLVTSGKNLDLPIVDHLIVTENGYYSFADEGILGAE